MRRRGTKPVPVAILRGHAAAVHGLAFLQAPWEGEEEEDDDDDPEALFLAAGTSSGELKLWSVASRRPLVDVASPAAAGGGGGGRGTAAVALAAAAASGRGEAALVARESICGVLGISSLGEGVVVPYRAREEGREARARIGLENEQRSDERARAKPGGAEEVVRADLEGTIVSGGGAPNLAVQRRSGAVEL